MAKGVNSPKVLAATHFYELFEKRLLRENQHLTFGHMELRLDANATNFEDQVTHLYK